MRKICLTYLLPTRGKDTYPLSTRGKDTYHLPTRGKDTYPLSTRGKDTYPLPTRGKDKKEQRRMLAPCRSMMSLKLLKCCHHVTCMLHLMFSNMFSNIKKDIYYLVLSKRKNP